MVSKLLSPFAEWAYAALRIVAGVAFAFHGAQKVLGLFATQQPPVGSQLWIGGLIELVCGVAIAVGFFGSWAAFLASGEMAVAYVQFHWKGRFDESFFPIVNQGELALIYCFLFLLIACKGAGRLSLDYQRARAKAARSAGAL